MDLSFRELLPRDTYEARAWRICQLYAVKLRMTAPRAIEVRYAFPCCETVWPMLGLSIAEHAFTMAQVIVPAYLEFLDVLVDKNIAPEKLESIALHHDDAEALTGDAATDVDGVTRSMKDAAEGSSIVRQYSDMVCHSFMHAQHDFYEARESYATKLVKMFDAIDLVFFAQYCVRNGVGMLQKGVEESQYVLRAFDELRAIDPRTYKEVSEYFQDGQRVEVPISEVMYDHSLPRVDKLGCPELTGLFKLLCGQAFKFPFEQFSLKHLPMDFVKFS